MNGSFKKIKTQYLVAAIIKSAVFGIAAGLLAAGVTLLGVKLADTEIGAGYYVLIGLGVAAVAGGILFFVLRPTDKKLAKKLDMEHGMHEKVRTMVAFEEMQGDVIEIQRQDAAARLAALPKEKFDIKKTWQYFLIGVLAVAIFVTGVVLPAKEAQAEPETPFDYSERQKAAVEQLIKDVEATSLTDEDKLSVTTMLNTMSATLENIEWESDMIDAVSSAVAFIDIVLYTSNSFDNIAYVLDADEKTEYFAAAITEGATFYRASAATITNLEMVKSLESGMDNAIADKVDADMDEFIARYDVPIADDLEKAISDINEVLKNVSAETVAAADDGIRLCVEAFKAEMAQTAENLSSYNDDSVQTAIAASVNTYKDALISAVKPQSYRCIADEFVRRRTAQIFGIATEDLPRLNSGIQELDNLPSEGDDENETNNGAPGKGDMVFGNNEYVYDPDTGELVPYGQYYSSYYASMMEQLGGEGVPENLKDSIKKYFDILYQGTLPSQEEN